MLHSLHHIGPQRLPHLVRTRLKAQPRRHAQSLLHRGQQEHQLGRQLGRQRLPGWAALQQGEGLGWQQTGLCTASPSLPWASGVASMCQWAIIEGCEGSTHQAPPVLRAGSGSSPPASRHHSPRTCGTNSSAGSMATGARHGKLLECRGFREHTHTHTHLPMSSSVAAPAELRMCSSRPDRSPCASSHRPAATREPAHDQAQRPSCTQLRSQAPKGAAPPPHPHADVALHHP